ncbi:MAG: hypothetical protein Q7W45_11395 [Bacteroidota bacterium]|nr:hypothetical protein [Bacteroidota bacterium]MDP3147070.1 hypothetical protein [Bacteroidota bacterium]
MKKVAIFLFVLFLGKSFSQPLLVNSSFYAHELSSIAFDSTNNKIFYNVSQGCTPWNIPCAMSYTSALYNLMNKYDFADNNLSTYLNTNLLAGYPSHPVSNFNASLSRQTTFQGANIYTNFGYYFNKIDTINLATIWSYTTNSGLKEISTFEIKNDSVFLFQRDSSSSINYYTVIVKNKQTGNTIPYSSLIENNPANNLGAIKGNIYSSTIINNKIILSGLFTASVSGVFIGRNLVLLDITTGQLQAPPVSIPNNTIIYDLKYKNNKVYIAGLFSSIAGQNRKNFAVLDNNLNLLSDTIQFTGLGAPSTVWLDKIVFYDNYLIAKGNFNKIDNAVVSASNTYSVRVINTNNNSVMPWTINLPPGGTTADGYTYQMVKNKLYMKKRGTFSPFYIYCFEPIRYSSTILYPGMNQSNPNPSVSVCAPDNNNSFIYTAPIKYGTSYNWTFSGTNATVVPIGNGNTAKLISGLNSTGGILSVTGTNDCGLSSVASTLNIVINQKPNFTSPISPQIIICNPDSTLLNGTSTNTNAIIGWRKTLTTTIKPQPFYAKLPGSYYMIVLDSINGCKDSSSITVNNLKAKPNSKITSHIYPGVSIPIDTVTCLKPNVIINAASDTSGVIITWKSIATNSVYSNPLSTSLQNNLKIIVTRTINNCVDSSLIVLVGQNNSKPNVVLNTSNLSLNCSYYTASLSAIFSPTNCSALWTGPLSFNATNPAVTNTIGKYFLTTNNADNGCSKVDSVIVNSNNNLVLKSSNDTTVCKQSSVLLNSINVGTLSGVTYTWSNGNNGNSISVSPNITTQFIVNASGPGGCNGKDTINIIIPKDIQDSIVAYRSCDNNQTGTIIIFAKGGIAPYKYSINNGATFLSSNSFTNIPFGNYSLVIKDSIGCIRSTSVSLNSSSSLPVPKFLASTKNFKSDTIVLVDISIPKADSVQWVLPTQASIIGGDMYNPIVAINDTGSFIVTMKAFYGNCIINATKLIRFSPQDSLHANYANANGIKTFNLFPNPNTGQFTVFVEFYKKQNVSIQAWDTSPFKHLQQNYYDVDSITLPVNLSQLQNGNYILRVIGEYDARNKSFIISK